MMQKQLKIMLAQTLGVPHVWQVNLFNIFHYIDSMNHWTKLKIIGESRSMDTFGPVNNLPINAYQYMLLMVDNASRCIMVSFHRNKDQDTFSE